MKYAFNFLKRSYNKTIQSIAFFPLLLSVLFLALSFVSLWSESTSVVIAIKQKLPQLFIQDNETIRTILSVLIGSIITLTVFSFTMVMVVLNQASSNFSPRLLPGLISDKKHQIILGIYIGTLLYCIVTLISLGAYGVDSQAMGLSTMIAAILGIICIGSFVYFIHTISEAIQIHHIIDRIFNESMLHLEDELLRSKQSASIKPSINTTSWIVIKSLKNGYYQGVNLSMLKDHVKNLKTQVEIVPYPNQYIWKGSPLLLIKNNVSDQEINTLIGTILIESHQQHIESNISGMTKLMEIAVKALSPGINDPGTAIEAIHKIALIFENNLLIDVKEYSFDDINDLFVIKNNITPQEILRLIIQPIRHYGKNDFTIIYKLIEMFQFLLSLSNSQDIERLFINEIEILKTYILKGNFTNTAEVSTLKLTTK